MSFDTTETIQRLFSQLTRDLVSELPAEQRDQYMSQLQRRANELLKNVVQDGGGKSFIDMIGLGPDGALPFDKVPVTLLEPDFDDSVVPTQLHAAADLYYIYQHERMKVFQVAGVLVRLFHEGRMRIQRGPGARSIYLLEKYFPLRYKQRDRFLAYRRVFNYGPLPAPSRAVVYRTFHRQFLAFITAVAQYFRDLLVSEVIRGNLDQRPFGSQATIERLGSDLRWQLDRATYGNVVALTLETNQYLKAVLDVLETPDVKKSFDANTKWDVVEEVSKRFLGGSAEIAQRSKMAEAGRQILRYVADNPFRTPDHKLFMAEVQPLGTVAEQWVAAYRMTPEGRAFRGVTDTLRNKLGLTQSAPQAA
jgi:hypothetical protein